jgi:hypothetical protein
MSSQSISCLHIYHFNPTKHHGILHLSKYKYHASSLPATSSHSSTPSLNRIQQLKPRRRFHHRNFDIQPSKLVLNSHPTNTHAMGFLKSHILTKPFLASLLTFLSLTIYLFVLLGCITSGAGIQNIYWVTLHNPTTKSPIEVRIGYYGNHLPLYFSLLPIQRMKIKMKEYN